MSMTRRFQREEVGKKCSKLPGEVHTKIWKAIFLSEFCPIGHFNLHLHP